MGSVRHIYLSFPHNRFATDISLSYDGSVDCATWHSVVAEALPTTLTDLETEQWTVRLSTTTNQFFVRARVTKL